MHEEKIDHRETNCDHCPTGERSHRNLESRHRSRGYSRSPRSSWYCSKRHSQNRLPASHRHSRFPPATDHLNSVYPVGSDEFVDLQHYLLR